MHTAQEIREITKDARQQMLDKSRLNIETAIEKFITPTILSRAKSGFATCEVYIPAESRNQDVIGSFLYWTEGKGKNKEVIKVYIVDVVNYLKEQGYKAVWAEWYKYIDIAWKEVEV